MLYRARFILLDVPPPMHKDEDAASDRAAIWSDFTLLVVNSSGPPAVEVARVKQHGSDSQFREATRGRCTTRSLKLWLPTRRLQTEYLSAVRGPALEVYATFSRIRVRKVMMVLTDNFVKECPVRSHQNKARANA